MKRKKNLGTKLNKGENEEKLRVLCRWMKEAGLPSDLLAFFHPENETQKIKKRRQSTF